MMRKPESHGTLAFVFAVLVFAADGASAQTSDGQETTGNSDNATQTAALSEVGGAPPSGVQASYDFQPPNQSSVALAIRDLVDQARWQPSRIAIDWKALRLFYGRRNFLPAWASASFASRAHETLARAGEEGLSPADYAADSIIPPPSGDTQRFARFDVLLTNSILLYAHDVHQGRIAPDLAYDDIGLKPAPFDPVSRLLESIRSGRLEGFLSSLPPPQSEYQSLKSLLAHYRQIEANGGWQRLSGPETQEPARAMSDRSGNDENARQQSKEDGNGEQGQDTASAQPDQGSGGPQAPFRDQLRQRLAAEGFTGGLRDALRTFQRNHDLDPTGAADRDTVLALNVGVEARIVQIEANMERWRWMPRTIEQTYVEVNVPAEHLAVMISGQPILTSRVVVGRESDPTPILRAMATSITVNPVWHIPQDIAEDEILPKGNSYLKEQRIQVGHRGTLRQLPGPKNALGTLKINMPNPFSIYMHDTPGKASFGRNERDESHGCVRVQKILELASTLLTHNPDSEIPQLKEMIGSGKTRSLTISPPVPVYVVYWSVTTASDGSAQFWPDLYSRDQSLIAEIQKRNVTERVSVL